MVQIWFYIVVPERNIKDSYYIYKFILQYALDASFLEIYNETIHDLLGDEDLKHDIKMSGQKNSNEVFVTNLTIVPVTKEEMVSHDLNWQK